jgi:hypothetical protein
MIKSLKQYLSLRGLLDRRLRAKKREIIEINKLLKKYPILRNLQKDIRKKEEMRFKIEEAKVSEQLAFG